MLPTQAKLTRAEKRELLTYHRAKQKREAKCQVCKEELEAAEQTCYWCGRQFNERDGVISDPKTDRGFVEDFFRTGKRTDEEKQEVRRKHREALRKRGAVTGKQPIKREDWAAFKAQHLQKK